MCKPLMRALFFEVEDDPRIWDFPHQYFLGDDLLVAPVVEPGATSLRVYLPLGEWVDPWTGDELAGPAIVTRAAPLEEIPVYVTARSASTLAVLFDEEPARFREPTEVG
jgi:alpha-glucosidase (family GH31 glycosyl hydrolase)